MRRNILTALVASVLVAACTVSSADAGKKNKRYRTYPPAPNASPSLDGRVLGRERTCGYATLQYDGLGVPYGPYCH
jgi:hypothetical protein